MLSVRLESEIEKRLAMLARETGRSVSYYAREAIEGFLDEMEDKYLAEQVLSNPGVRYTQDEVERLLDIKGD